jgi:hypothetical protein
MSGDGALRKRNLESVGSDRLPDRPPARWWGGLGSGAPCAVCSRCVNADELEFELEFAGENGEQPDYYHVHLRCYSTWKSGRLKRGSAPGNLLATELSAATGDIRFGADEREPSDNGGAA